MCGTGAIPIEVKTFLYLLDKQVIHLEYSRTNGQITHNEVIRVGSVDPRVLKELH